MHLLPTYPGELFELRLCVVQPEGVPGDFGAWAGVLCALYARVLLLRAVVPRPAVEFAVNQTRLVPKAPHVVHKIIAYRTATSC